MATECEGENRVSPAQKHELECLQGVGRHINRERKQAALPSQAEACRWSLQEDSALPRRARPSSAFFKTTAFWSAFCFLTSDGGMGPEKCCPYQEKERCAVDDKGQQAFILGDQETPGKDRCGGNGGTRSMRSSPWGISAGWDSGVLSPHFSKDA